MLIDAELNTTISLECHYCNEKDDQEPKIWYRQDRYQSEKPIEISLDMDNNITYNRIHVTPEFSLLIRDYDLKDEGLYRCHGANGQEEEWKFNYRLESIFKDIEGIYREKGNLTDWEKYHETNLAPVSLRFKVSSMPSLVKIREMGVELEIVSEWGPWSPCERCIRKKGWKTRVAMCRVKRTMNRKPIEGQGENISVVFMKSPMWPCRSIALYDAYPEIGKATKNLPEFMLEEKCKRCPPLKKYKKDKFRYKKRYVLAEDAHLTIACPEASMDTEVVWKKDKVTLKKGTGHSFRRKDPEPRVLVDTFATLYLLGVTEAEAGNYTCYVDKVNMLKVKVIVVSRSRLLTRAFLRHVGYLGFILLMSSFCYCAGLVIVCRQRNKFTITDYKEIEARENDKADFFESDA
ncbi:uncharacterized protein LOC105690755 [Athalia rosae]|uniref:uncharacterized protein LOC105690755 n=1 Tax=Athalia rosae TaxID=37344 RepID=UPI0020344A78|nr:uncharacterized protein LOC105690755 [Athalia rosae]